jgi:hypothetical protein
MHTLHVTLSLFLEACESTANIMVAAPAAWKDHEDHEDE